MRFGDYLKSKRKQKNITQEDLARSLSVSSVFIHQLETGKVDAPSIDRCQQIAAILDVNIRRVVDSCEERTPQEIYGKGRDNRGQL